MPSIKYAVDVDTKGARSSLAQLQRSISNVGIAVAGGFAGGALVQFADSITGLRNKLAAFSSSQDEVNQKFDTIVSIAGRARSDLGAVGDLYGKMTVASQALGLSQDQVAQITETFTKSLKVGGATAQEASSAILQFSQAMGSGVLRGEEFNAVMEASPSTMLDLSRALGVPIGSMRKLAEEGKLTSKVVSQAMLKMQTEVENKFKKTVPTIGDALNNVRTAASAAFVQLSQEPGPAQVFIKAAQAIINFTTDIERLTAMIKSLTTVVISLGIAWLGVNRGPELAKKAMEKYASFVLSSSHIVKNQTELMGEAWTSVKKGIVGIGASFGVLDAGRGKIMKTTADMGLLATSFARVRQFGLSLGTVLTGMLRIGLRFAGWVGVFMAVVDAINFLYQAVTGSNKKLIDMGGIFKGVWTVLRVLWGLLKVVGNYIGQVFAPFIEKAANAWNSFISAIMNFGPIKAAGEMLDWVGSKLSALWQKAKDISGVTAADRKAELDKQQADLDAKLEGMGLGKSSVNNWLAKSQLGNIPLGEGTGGKGGGKSAKEIAKEQAEALAEVKKAVNEITKAYQELATARLQDLDFQLRSLGMSEDQITLEQNRRDILKEQSDALKDLAAKELEVKNSKDLSKKGREEALALIAQETAAIKQQTQEQLAASEAQIKAIQAETLAIDARTKAMELSQQANQNRAALQALEDQLSLVGLYGDKLDEVTAQLELQNELRQIEVEYQNQLLDLDNQRKKLGEERYAMELANIQAVKAQAIEAANAQATAQKKLSDAIKKSERTDVKAAIGKRAEEMKRSIDPVIVALDSFNSVFDNMSNALDNFIETGKFKFSDFARSIIVDLAKIAAKAALTKLFSAIGGSLFGRAAGGPVQGNQPYLVGENGPELFVPGSNGSIMTNASLNKNAGMGGSAQPVVNNTYITNNISAIDSRSVAQMFVENRKSLLGATTMARKELPYS